MTAIKSCSACGGQISKQAKTCPHCGHPNQISTPAGIVIIFCFLALAFFIWLIFAQITPTNRVSAQAPALANPVVASTDPVDAAIAKAAKDESLDAYLTACEYCKMYAPSGINFTTSSGESVTEGHARWVTNNYGVPNWIAVGFVDSQNELGAMRHQKWFASVVPSGEKWKLMFLKIGDEDFVNHYASP